MEYVTNNRTLLRLGDSERAKLVYSSDLYCTESRAHKGIKKGAITYNMHQSTVKHQ